MKRCILFLLLCLAGILAGCSKADPPQEPLCRIVTQINVTAAHNGIISHHIYTEPQKMETMLNYLRLLHPDTTVDIEPSTFRSNAYQITVSYSDGNTSNYYQIYNSYLRKDSGSWKQIDTDQGSALYPILCSMPSDSETIPPLAFSHTTGYNAL